MASQQLQLGSRCSKEKIMKLSSIRARLALRSLVIHVTLAATAGAAEALTIWVLNR